MDVGGWLFAMAMGYIGGVAISLVAISWVRHIGRTL